MGAVREPNDDRPARGRLGQELRMIDRNSLSISQMDVERLERASGVHFPKLLDGHTSKYIAPPERKLLPYSMNSEHVGEL